MGADFDVLKNGAAVTGQVFIPGDGHTTQQFVIVHKDGAAAAGKLVVIDPSCPVYLDTLGGNLDGVGHFTFNVGPSMGAKGNVVLTLTAGSKKTVSLAILFT